MDVATMKEYLENQIGDINKDLENIYLPHEAVLILLGKRTAFKIALELIDSLQQEQQPAECIPDSIKFDEGFKTGREVGFREGVESVKPAEWKEEDEAMLANVLGTYKTLEDMLNLSTGQDRDILESMNFERDWLKGRFKSLRPQPQHRDTYYDIIRNMYHDVGAEDGGI